MTTVASISSSPVVPPPSAQRIDLAPPDPGALSWGAISSALMALISLGVLPAFVWARRLDQFADRQRLQLSQATDWALAHHPPIQARRGLLRATQRLGPSEFLVLLPKFATAFVVSLLGMELLVQRLPLPSVLDLTYFFQRLGHPWLFPNFYAVHPQMVHRYWMVGLCIAYLAQWIHLRRCRASVVRWVMQWNKATAFAGVIPLRVRWGWGISPLALVGAVGLGYAGIWWGVAMLLAASAQSRYTLRASRSLAIQLADRMNRPAGQAGADQRCAGPGCTAVVPASAKFCPRCGMRVSHPEVDVRG